MFNDLNLTDYIDGPRINGVMSIGQSELDKSRARMKQYREKYKMISRKIMQLKSFTRKNYQGGERFIYDQFARSYLQTALAGERENARKLMVTINIHKYYNNQIANVRR